MTIPKQAVVAGGCFWGEKRTLGASQDLDCYFVSEAKQNSDKVYRSCKE